MIRLFPVIVETDLADRHDLPGLCQHTEFGKFFLVKLRRAARMDTCCPIDKRIFFRQGNRRLRTCHIRADIDDRADPACCQTGKKFFPVPVKRFIIVMSVCIKYHISYIPFSLADLRTRRHLFLRCHQGQLSVCILGTQNHALGEQTCQFRRF